MSEYARLAQRAARGRRTGAPRVFGLICRCPFCSGTMVGHGIESSYRFECSSCPTVINIPPEFAALA